jgi:hypothetical protein
MKERFMAEKVQREEFEILKDLEFHAFEEEEDEEESEDFDFGTYQIFLNPKFRCIFVGNIFETEFRKRTSDIRKGINNFKL